MALEQLRDFGTEMLDPLVAKLGFLNPNYISWFSLAVAGFAAWFFATAGSDKAGGMLIFAAVGLTAFAAICDAMDGQIARKHNKVSSYGDYLDHTIDRIVDAGILIAIGINAHWVDSSHLGYLAGLTTLLGSYMGTQAQSVGLGRNYRGFSRADRLMMTVIGGLIAGWQAISGTSGVGEIPIFGGEFNGMSTVLVIALLGGIYTFFVRFISARKQLIDEINAP
ncbi:MAG TPA: CDP-alcohol phosphatidyltransferase family protein [Candidatus Thalassarchaeaceae archaeon]|nr:CDP-alcohol phosphatidyltransferase family protein [Candidatus Thalassarchaeaceae archaeon]